MCNRSIFIPAILLLLLSGTLQAQIPGAAHIPPRECDCPAQRVTDHWCRASVIFLGEVTAADTIYAKNDVGKWERDIVERITVGFIVEHTFKGSTNAMINIDTGLDDRSCAFTFRKGAKYLVFAHDEGGELAVDRCGGTREADTVSRGFSDSLDHLLSGGTYEIAGEQHPDCDEPKVGAAPESGN